MQWRFNNSGTLDVQSGTIDFQGGLSQTSGQILLNGGTVTVSVGQLQLGGGTIGGHGTINGPISNRGTIAPGSSAGVIDISGDFQQQGEGTLSVEIGGLAPGVSLDQLQVGGRTTLDGLLEVSLLDGETVSLGDRFEILKSTGGVSGKFSRVRSDLPNGLGVEVDYSADTVFISIVESRPGLPGDFDGDSLLTATDIDLLLKEVKSGSHELSFDLDGNKLVDQGDIRMWIQDLKHTWFGDANLDGEFNSGDLVEVFKAGHYEDGISMNSGWATGDWDGDGDFTSGDLVVAFKDGGYEKGPRPALAAVPEPSGTGMMMIGLALAIASTTRRRGRRS